MKVITDYFTSPRSLACSQKSVESLKNSETSNKNSEDESDKPYYGLRKIKIRLADPNNPDSYVCEVYDTSHEESLEEDTKELKSGLSVENNSKVHSISAEPVEKSAQRKIAAKKSGSIISPADNVLTERNQPPPDSQHTRRRLSSRVRNPTPGVVEAAMQESTKKRPRPAKESCSKGSIINYFKRSVREGTSKETAKPQTDLDCVVVLERVAPVFLPPPKKPKIDAEVEKARKAFLQSGIPASVKRAAAKAQTCLGEVSFWAVSHVQQRCGETVWESRPINLNLRDEETYQNRSLMFRWPCIAGPTHTLCETKSRKIDAKAVEKLKVAYKQIPIEKMYSCIKELHRVHEEEKKEDVVWSEKYRPSTEGVLGNDKTVESLKNWLLEWKENGYSQRARKGGSDTDDSDEESSGLQTACLLEGPVASGKTALVYALASELDLNVIEINASSKRSGKKLQAELQEATRSREVREETGSALILVEDADIVFEEDEGFLPALQNLVSSTRRPVILLTSDPSIRHLDRFRGRCSLQLRMVRPHSSVACALLELICIFEGACPPRSSLLRLIRSNKLDLRKSLLEIQLWNGRGGWEVPRDGNISATALWWTSHQFIFGQPLWHDLEEKKSEGTVTDSKNSPQLKTLTRFFDGLSYSDLIGKTVNEDSMGLCWKICQAKDSASLAEDWQVYSRQTEDLGRAISSEILRLACPVTIALEPGTPPSETRWIESRLRASSELDIAVPNGAGRTGPLEYLPTLRTMLRAEIQVAAAAFGRRRSRGSHYLRSLGISPSAANATIITNTFHSSASR